MNNLDKTKDQVEVFLFAGEVSGDLHGGQLIRAMQRNKKFSFSGVGGTDMRACGLKCLMPMENFQVMGFSDVLFALPSLWKQFHIIVNHIIDTQPKIVILIDYPGLNLRLAKALRSKGFTNKIVHYICPSVWAHGKNRINQMSSTLDLLLTIFPFEPSYFAHTSLPVTYVGNPLVDVIRNYPYDNMWWHHVHMKSKCDENNPLIAIFPGSRKKELQHNLPKQIAAAEILKKEFSSLRYALSLAHLEHQPLALEILKKSSLTLDKDIYIVPKRYTYELMRDSHTAIATSGTVTLELALHSRPTVVAYHITTFNKLVAKYVLRLNLPHYCIVNILAQKRIFPELIQEPFSSHSIYQQIKMLNGFGSIRQNCLAGCAIVRDLLTEHNKLSASDRAADAIIKLLTC